MIDKTKHTVTIPVADYMELLERPSQSPIVHHTHRRFDTQSDFTRNNFREIPFIDVDDNVSKWKAEGIIVRVSNGDVSEVAYFKLVPTKERV